MRKVLIILLFLITIGHAYSRTVAKVGDQIITSNELLEEMQKYESKFELTYSEIRKKALRELINEKALIQYALEENIYVDDNELEAFFMQQLGNHDMFLTNDSFDYSKFEDFKNTKKGRSILSEMKNEILLNKTKTLIFESFTMSDKSVYEKYFAENTKIDLEYAIINAEDTNVPLTISFQEVRKYYKKNKRKYKIIEKVKFDYFMIFKEEFRNTVRPSVEKQLKEKTLEDTTLNKYELIKLQTKIEEQECSKFCKKKILALTELWKNNEDISYPIIRTPFLSRIDQLGKLPSEIISYALNLNEGEYSKPINIGNGFLVLKVLEKENFQRQDDLVVANEIWKDYISNESNINPRYSEYFKTNFEKFIVSAAVINTIEIKQPSLFSFSNKREYQNEIKERIKNNIYNKAALQDIAREYGLKSANKVIYLDTFTNETTLDNTVAELIKNQHYFGFIPDEDKIVYYQMSSYFPEYIPKLKNIQDQLYKIIEISETDSTNFLEYYATHKKDFTSPDSLKLAGVIFPFDDVNITVSIDSLSRINRAEYNKNINKYYRDNSVKFDYILVKNRSIAKSIEKESQKDISFSFLSYCYHLESPFPRNVVIEYSELPEEISHKLNTLGSGDISSPIKYNDNWLILLKKREYKAGIIPFEEIKIELLQKDIHELKKKEAFKNTKSVFDSTRYYSQLKNYVNEDEIFITPMQDVNKYFEILGPIEDYKANLLRMWKGEKYSQIIEIDEGFILLFLLDKRRSRVLKFSEALPKIKEALGAKKRFDNSKRFVQNLRRNIIKGSDPDDQLFFLNGWFRKNDLSLKGTIPGIEMSEIILDDAVKREIGYYSPVLPLQQKEFFFYHISNLSTPSRKEYLDIKENYKEQLKQKKFKSWLQQYKATKEIKSY